MIPMVEQLSAYDLSAPWAYNYDEIEEHFKMFAAFQNTTSGGGMSAASGPVVDEWSGARNHLVRRCGLRRLLPPHGVFCRAARTHSTPSSISETERFASTSRDQLASPRRPQSRNDGACPLSQGVWVSIRVVLVSHMWIVPEVGICPFRRKF